MFYYISTRRIASYGSRTMFRSTRNIQQQVGSSRLYTSSRNRFVIFTQYDITSFQTQTQLLSRPYLNIDLCAPGISNRIVKKSSTLSGGSKSTNFSLDLDCGILDDDDDG
jgi:hypothetical protein